MAESSPGFKDAMEKLALAFLETPAYGFAVYPFLLRKPLGIASVGGIDDFSDFSGDSAKWLKLETSDKAQSELEKMQIRSRVNVMAGLRRDMRRWYAYGKDCVPKTDVNVYAEAYAQCGGVANRIRYDVEEGLVDGKAS